MRINHSGGCPGADMTWENEGLPFGVHTISYSFYNHIHDGRNPQILTMEELKEGFDHILIANETLKRNITDQAPYVKNLLARNWFQVKNAEAVFAIGTFDANGRVNGGTGWACQMAIDNNKPVYVFDQDLVLWKEYTINGAVSRPPLSTLTLTSQFAGIGTRAINKAGIEAIQHIYRFTNTMDNSLRRIT